MAGGVIRGEERLRGREEKRISQSLQGEAKGEKTRPDHENVDSRMVR
jgi:hypothetical protein